MLGADGEARSSRTRRRLAMTAAIFGSGLILLLAFIFVVAFGMSEGVSTTVLNDTGNTVAVELIQPPGIADRPVIYVIEPHASRLIAGGSGVALYRVTDQGGVEVGCLAVDFTGKGKATATRSVSAVNPCPVNVATSK